MKKQKQSLLIHVWESYEFYLYIPETINRNSKPFIFYYFFDNRIQKPVRIRKFIGQSNGDKKEIQKEAKKTVLDLITLLDGNWNPIIGTFNELSITPLSPIKTCIQYWIEVREKSFNNETIGFKRLKSDKIVMMHFTDYLKTNNLLDLRPSQLTNIHIKEFIESKAFQKKWSKVTYNTYLIDIGTFFNYLLDMNLTKENPVRRIQRKTTRFDSSRFKVFELNELSEIANLLANDKAYRALNVASKILFKYNIRPLEITRIQVKDVNWDSNILTLPPTKTKNKNEAKFILDDETSALLKAIIGNAGPDYYIFCKRNTPSLIPTFDDYLGQRWRAFRNKYNLPSHLKFYALKHSSNYYDIENGSNYEEIRQRNRHSNLQVTTLYIKERLFKNVIKPSNSTQF